MGAHDLQGIGPNSRAIGERFGESGPSVAQIRLGVGRVRAKSTGLGANAAEIGGARPKPSSARQIAANVLGTPRLDSVPMVRPSVLRVSPTSLVSQTYPIHASS